MLFRSLHRDQIQQQILDGGKQMPPFKDVLNDEETRELFVSDVMPHFA